MKKQKETNIEDIVKSEFYDLLSAYEGGMAANDEQINKDIQSRVNCILAIIEKAKSSVEEKHRLEVEPKEGDFYRFEYLNSTVKIRKDKGPLFSVELPNGDRHQYFRDELKQPATPQEVAAYIEEKHRLEVEALIAKHQAKVDNIKGTSFTDDRDIVYDLKELINPNQKD
jgi:hypothetical protein